MLTGSTKEKAVEASLGENDVLLARAGRYLQIGYVGKFSAGRKVKEVNRRAHDLNDLADYKCLLKDEASENDFLHISIFFLKKMMEMPQQYRQET